MADLGLGRRTKARLRQREGDDPFILFERRLAALNRSQLPALKILTDFQPDHRLGRLIEKYPESFIVHPMSRSGLERRAGRQTEKAFPLLGANQLFLSCSAGKSTVRLKFPQGEMSSE
jgi:hypothetical protein